VVLVISSEPLSVATLYKGGVEPTLKVPYRPATGMAHAKNGCAGNESVTMLRK